MDEVNARWNRPLCGARTPSFKTRGKLISDFDSNIERIAQMRMALNAMRLVVYNAAETLGLKGPKDPKAERAAIVQCKVLVPKAIEQLVNDCMQMFGGQGLTQYTPLPVRHQPLSPFNFLSLNYLCRLTLE